MGKPAARVGDAHGCPLVTPGANDPHVGGPITGPGCKTVLIEGKPAATAGDTCACNGAEDKIIGGSSGVFIEGKPAARQGDPCVHGGVVIGGSTTVLIGESMGVKFLILPGVWENDGHNEPPKEKKIEIVKQAIADCIVLLENKLGLLLHDDPETLVGFEKWFGFFNPERKAVIVERMERQLGFFRGLGLEKFDKIINEDCYRNLFAEVFSRDKNYIIYLGNLFWNDSLFNKYARTKVLIHEVSHFKSVGGTADHKYDNECEGFGKVRPQKALYNADSYAFFITGYK